MPISNFQYRKCVGYNNARQKVQNNINTLGKNTIFSQKCKTKISHFILAVFILSLAIWGVSAIFDTANEGLNCNMGSNMMIMVKNNAKITNFHIKNKLCYVYDPKIVNYLNSKFTNNTKYKNYNKINTNNFIITNKTYSKILQKSKNKTIKTINGNFKIKNLKLLLTNKGPAYFENKIDDMSYIIDKFKPDIMAISESNISKKNLTFKNNFSDYNFELNKMYDNYGFSRNALMVKEGISYKRRYDLENNTNCMIWIEIKLNTKKSILIMGGYCQ